VTATSATYGSASTTLSATLTTPGGPLAGKTISFALNGSPAGNALTDATGLAAIQTSLTGLGAGSYPITASFAGDVNNTAASASTTFILNPAVLTITAADATRIYGDPNPAFSFTITGFVNGDTSAVLSGSPACTSADPTAAVGTYPITCAAGTLSAGNYTFTFVSGNQTVTPAALSVAAADATRVYGDPNSALTGTITGIKNGDNITATYSSAATAASAVGTYPITPALVDPTAKLGNYTVTSSNGTLTVTPAPLSVTAANVTRAYGDPNNLTGTITGVKNSDNITATYSTTASATSGPGTYPITATLVDPTNKLSNYSVVITNNTLTVTPATLTVIAANASMVYGDAVPALSGTISGIKNGDNITASYSTTATSSSAPGTYPIVAAVSDNGTGALANYTVVISNGTLTVSAAPLVVTAANASRLYGDPNPGFTGTITGLKNGDNIGAIFSAAADPTSPVGNYAIIPTLSDPNNKLGNYTVTLNNGVLTVAPAPLSVVAADTSRLYGDPNPAFSGTLTGIKNGDNITASYSSAADPTSPVGTYPIVPSLADPTSKLANYTVTSVNGTLTILQAPLTIQANDATGTAGQPFPTFSGTITGLKNSDVITSSYSTPADQTSPAGTYPIIPGADPSPALANYAVTLINGTLTLQ
jgi:hypothetical protein